MTRCLEVPSCFRYRLQLSASHPLHAGFLLGFFFEHEDEGDVFFWNVG
jgi:hypothetical protein